MAPGHGQVDIMMTPPAPRPTRSVPAPAGADARPLDGTNINPATGLATDFLNHFNEAIMLLELLPTAPDCKADFLAWHPMNYREHFAASRFKHRDLAIAAYEAANPVFRRKLDEIADHMNTILTATRDGLRRDLTPRTTRILAAATARWLKPLVARAGAVINGELVRAAHHQHPGADAMPQDAVDALFDHAVDAVFHR
jgi:hypothetical protein